MTTFHYHILRTIDFGGDKLLIVRHDSKEDFIIAELEFDYLEYEWQWMNTVSEEQYRSFINFIETIFAFDTRGFTIKLLDTLNLPSSFDLQGPIEKDYTNDANVLDEVKLEKDVQEHIWSLWRAARETIQDPW